MTTATKFVGDEQGCVKEVHTVQIEWQKNEKGQFTPKEVPGTEKVRAPRNWCCWRWGSWGREQLLLEQLGVEDATGARMPAAEHGKYATNVKGVFAAGDARRGQSLVVWAFNEGRGAARECDHYLMGRTNLP